MSREETRTLHPQGIDHVQYVEREYHNLYLLQTMGTQKEVASVA